MLSDLTYQVRIENTVSAANKLAGWAMRSFRRRSRSVMRTIWRCLIQCKLDYCSQLWSPSDQASITSLECVARHFTQRVAGQEDSDYWERLGSLNLFSQERRRERYQVIFIWKVAQGLVKGYSIPFYYSDRRGRLVHISQVRNHSPSTVKNAREASLKVKGSKLLGGPLLFSVRF